MEFLLCLIWRHSFKKRFVGMLSSNPHGLRILRPEKHCSAIFCKDCRPCRPLLRSKNPKTGNLVTLRVETEQVHQMAPSILVIEHEDHNMTLCKQGVFESKS